MLLLLPGSQVPASPGDNGSEQLSSSPPGISHSSSFSPAVLRFLLILTNFHVFLLCSFCGTAVPCRAPAPVTMPRPGPRCTEASLREARVPGPRFLHPHRIRPCGVRSTSAPTALGRRKLGSRQGQRPRPGGGAAPPVGTLAPGQPAKGGSAVLGEAQLPAPHCPAQGTYARRGRVRCRRTPSLPLLRPTRGSYPHGGTPGWGLPRQQALRSPHGARGQACPARGAAAGGETRPGLEPRAAAGPPRGRAA